MYREKTTIPKRYIRLDKSVLFYLLLKNNIKPKSKIYRYISLCITRYHLRSLDILGISDFCYRLYKLAHKLGEDELQVHRFVQDLNSEYCRRIKLCNFSLPKIKIDMGDLRRTTEIIIKKFNKDDKHYILENIQAYFGTKSVGMLNVRVFEDVLLEYFRFKQESRNKEETLTEYMFVCNVVLLSNKIYSFYVNESLNYI